MDTLSTFVAWLLKIGVILVICAAGYLIRMIGDRPHALPRPLKVIVKAIGYILLFIILMFFIIL